MRAAPRWLMLGLLLLAALFASPVAASASLESRIQTATGIVRAVDPALQARAAIRAIEIQTTLGHCCLAYGEAEIIGRDSGYADPVGALVIGWANSPEHAAILSDPSYRKIGCALAVSGARTYGVCLFSATVAPQPPAKPTDMPNTALPS